MISSIYNQRCNKLQSTRKPLLAGITNTSEVALRSVPNLSVNLILTAPDTIGEIEWNSNGTLIYATVPSSGSIHVWSIHDPDWSCRIQTGSTGFSRVEWHPSSPIHLLVYSEFNTKVDVWNLHDQSKTVVAHVLSSVGLVVSNSKKRGLFFATLPEHESDVATVMDIECTDLNKNCFRVLSRFPLTHKPLDIVGASWTANDDGFLIWESPIKSHIVHYDLHGNIVSKTDIYPDIPTSVACRPLGVTCAVGNRDILCLGTFMNTVQVYSLRGSVRLLAEFSLKESTIVVCNDNPRVYRESLGGCATVLERNMYYVGGSGYETHGVEYRAVVPEKSSKIDGFSTVEIPIIDQPKGTEGRPRHGVVRVCLSPDGMYLVCISHNRPSTAFIFDLSKMTLAFVLIHRRPILDTAWSPRGEANRNELSITTGDARVFLWSPNEKSRIISMKDKSFKPTTTVWSPCGASLIVSDGRRTCSVNLSETVSTIGG